MTPLLEVSDLRKEYASRGAPWGPPRPPVKAVDGVSFTVARGETLGLVGESGSGKSTTGRLILRLIEPTGGRVRFDGLPVEELRGQTLFAFRRRAQMVFQDPFSSLNPRHTIGQILAEPLKLHHICPPGEVTARVRALLQRVGLRAEHAERYPHEFSGGQRQRIGIARALSLGPELVVADEPVSALDVSVQAQILNLLQEIQAEEKLAMLFIAHDLAVVRRVSHRIAVMLNGQLVETGPAEEVCLRPQHPYTRALIASVPGIEWSAENRSQEVS